MEPGQSSGSSPDVSDRDHASFVKDLYRGVLRREPHAREVEGWCSALSSGVHPYSVTRSFTESEEAQKLRKANVFVPAGHFYSPIVDPEEAAVALSRAQELQHSESLPGIELDRSAMVDTWNRLLPFMLSSPFKAERSNGFRYAYNNSAYEWGDGSILHALLRLYRPSKLIEIGSGWSSICTVETVRSFLDNRCEMTFIDPYPQLFRELAGQLDAGIRVIEDKVQNVPLSEFESLGPGDFLFIDSSHVLRTGSDVHYELLNILPVLKRGVLVHIHDMFWPFEYPEQWAVQENRSWNEIYAVRALLTNSDRWKILFFNDYFAKLEHATIESTFPDFLQSSGGALWLTS